MFWPIVACVLLPWLLVYLGLHVVQRGIIFIDIAMAQMASLGICLAVLLHLDLSSAKIWRPLPGIASLMVSEPGQSNARMIVPSTSPKPTRYPFPWQ